MNILYGVCGDGFGHSSRASIIIENLTKKGHKVKIITYGKAYKILKKYKPIKVSGLEIKFIDSKVSFKKTINSSIKNIIKDTKNFKKILNEVDKFSPDLCISDMEPIVPIIRYWKKLPLISIDNQHRLTHQKIKVPKKYEKDYLIAKTVTESFVKRANYFLILTFAKTSVRSKNAILADPILRNEIIKIKPGKKDFILVYLTRPNKELIKNIKKINEKFIVYGHSKKNMKKENITFKKTGPEFIKDLRECKAIIGTAGFTLISESLYLKKPYYAIPLQGQFEQTLNALFIKNSKLGDYSEKPDLEDLNRFIKEIDRYEKKLKTFNYNPNELIEKLDIIINNLSK
jgi:uncharacterized protein (TIGR00661 family)